MLARACLSGLLLGTVVPASSLVGHAQDQAPKSAGGVDMTVVIEPDADRTVGIIGGEPGSTMLQAVHELAANTPVGDLRIMPIAGRGPLQNLADLLNVKGADGAIVQTDVLDYAARNDLIGELAEKLGYMTMLYNAEFHLIARSDETGLAALNGRRINTGVAGSGTQVTASAVLKAAGIDYVATSFDTATALEKLKTGEIDGVVYVDGAPAPLLMQLDPADGLKLLDVPISPAIAGAYQPAWLQHNHYGRLIERGKMVETVSVGTVLVAFNWPVHSKGNTRLVHLYEVLAGGLNKLAAKPNHPVWRSVTLSARLAGWERHRAALAGQHRAEGGFKQWQSDRVRALRTDFKALLNQTGGQTTMQ